MRLARPTKTTAAGPSAFCLTPAHHLSPTLTNAGEHAPASTQNGSMNTPLGHRSVRESSGRCPRSRGWLTEGPARSVSVRPGVKDVVILLGKSRWSISNAIGVSVTGARYSISLAFKSAHF
jgi:hypothetical protein